MNGFQELIDRIAKLNKLGLLDFHFTDRTKEEYETDRGQVGVCCSPNGYHSADKLPKPAIAIHFDDDVNTLGARLDLIQDEVDDYRAYIEHEAKSPHFYTAFRHSLGVKLNSI